MTAAATSLPFRKMHGCRNDYVVLDGRGDLPADLPAFARWACHRTAGIGADGILVVGPAPEADFAMRMLNVDGLEAEMCGNGLRCAARYAVEAGLCGPGPDLHAQTGAGILPVQVRREGAGWIVSADLGVPRVPPGALQDLPGAEGVRYAAVDLGNPHAIVVVEDVDRVPLATWGPACQDAPAFPEGVNLSVIQVVDRGRLRQRTWERGCGETQACGTGASAAALAAMAQGLVDEDVEIALPGGTLRLTRTAAGGVRMEGPAEAVYAGTIPGRPWAPTSP